MNSLAVRDGLEEALRLNLIGPDPGHELAHEELPGWIRPSNWYLAGFLVPRGAEAEARSDDDAEDDIGAEILDGSGLSEESAEDLKAAKRTFFPSSMGLSFLAAEHAEQLAVTVSWGEYERAEAAATASRDGRPLSVWRRRPRREAVTVALGAGQGTAIADVPDSGGLELHVVERVLTGPSLGPHIPPGARAVSLFLVNERVAPAAREQSGTADIFQAEIEVRSEGGFLGRPDPRRAAAQDLDAQIADLHFADAPEFATGHGVSADWEVAGGVCRRVWTSWIGRADVEKIEAVEIPGAELSMELLGAVSDGAAAAKMLGPLVTEYRGWIEEQSALATGFEAERATTATKLLHRAGLAAARIERGIRCLAAPEVLDAFRMANRAVAAALSKRNDERDPKWRAFQIAFILVNLPALANPGDLHRETADLLFFPTGGGKTEAYLGLAAFAMVLRRLRNPGAGGRSGAGVSVIMRYTLRLLTIDQLGRAAGLVCALDLERERNPERYGEWPFEIGLWVGTAATPNQMGRKGKRDPRKVTARSRCFAFQSDPQRASPPIPLPNCPWCGKAFGPYSFSLEPTADRPRDLRVRCADPACDFTRDRPLPIVAVDEPLYRRLPAFLIATVDKFAALPWVGPSGSLLGGADRWDRDGFYGPAAPRIGRKLPRPLPPPDLIVQDELHLITGPLGTMAGLYETAIDALASREVDGQQVRPKLVASTATATRAHAQVQAVFGRARTAEFPPPGPDRRDSFFARTQPADVVPARRYLGISAPGRNPKLVMRRVLETLAGAAEKAWWKAGGDGNLENPADPYMTLLGYFNALRELGGARRIIEEEVQHTLRSYGQRRRRIGEPEPQFRNRDGRAEVMELTSRVSTAKVAEARRRLGLRYHEPKSVAWAIATNMISVGLDIQRLGLMVVAGQPKTHSEYIQATSRVGRDDRRPGLVVSLLNIHKPRDRSHYERFRHYHETFYRSVEAASATPFAARALDRGFAGAFLSLARHVEPRLTPPLGATEIWGVRDALEDPLITRFVSRLDDQEIADPDDRDLRERRVHDLARGLLDAWEQVRSDLAKDGVSLAYQQFEPGPRGQPLLRDMLEEAAVPYDRFRAGRSLRDVEPEVQFVVRDPEP